MSCTIKMHTEDFLLKEENNCHRSMFCLRFPKIFSSFAMYTAFICLGLALTANGNPCSCVLQFCKHELRMRFGLKVYINTLYRFIV